MLTWEPWPNSSLLRAVVKAGASLPTAIPAIMQRNTQRVR